MEEFVSRKRQKRLPSVDQASRSASDETAKQGIDSESTDFKLAMLASLYSDRSQDVLLDYLLAYHGSVEAVSNAIEGQSSRNSSPRKRPLGASHQSSLVSFGVANEHRSQDIAEAVVKASTRPLTRKGRTVDLYSPEDIEQHTPCSIIHNFLPPDQADALLEELLLETPYLRKERFQMFDRTVETPHTFGFYVDTLEEQEDQRAQYVYNGGVIPDVRQTPPEMLKVSAPVRKAVNAEIQKRMKDTHSGGRKLKFQSPEEWKPNTAFVNCYDGGKESVGYHSDQLTYLGPRAVIGSLSLGVARRFMVRRIVPQGEGQADAQGQIAIHLPHNSLLVMHAMMQEEWKHAVAPAAKIEPHPIAGNRRLNVTYRCYKEYLHPEYTPRCKCGVACVLRCVQKQEASRGRYMWMCHAQYSPGQKGCGFFTWADFDEDGKPPWAKDYGGNANLPNAAFVENGGTKGNACSESAQPALS
ncbi:hypothetical protein K431DRAFT_285230 [Polychaeton citri CBS 116435]|uniref:Fe2OG dioxygenase domain-containing protein n=1 Tax=Polychaeton citri CBS 116435 TaxID=1314669 RepID=A0A9P4Q7G7_9PEZI|nr:hypothetical protein K431DRAFT_285230 [Polychaeton citri CBS 116435]